MKRRHKLGIFVVGLLASAYALSSCTANFCTNKEKSRILFAMEPGVSEYYNSKDAAEADRSNAKYYDKDGNAKYAFTEPEQVFTGNENLWRMVAYSNSDKGSYYKSKELSSINTTALKNGFSIPTLEYFIAVDNLIINKAVEDAGYDKATVTYTEVLGYEKPVADGDDRTIHEQGALEKFGNYKFSSDNEDELFGHIASITNTLRLTLGDEKCPSADYEQLYQSQMESVINNYRSCITTVEGNYGAYGQEATSIHIEAQSWGDAWHKGGAVIEGLIVFPVAWMVDQFAYLIAGGSGVTANQVAAAYQTGVPQLLSLLIVTVIVRLFIFLVTFKSTMSQQKMTRLQPELAKIQAKYPNSNTNQAQKQRLAEEQMKLYKKNKVNPLSSLLVLVVQFPIFIGVWGAMTGSAVLSTGAFLNLNLSTSIWNCLTSTSALPSNDTGWWTALVLIILMSVSQFLSMKLPQWISKAKSKKVAKLGKNPAQKSQNRTMNIVSYVMLIMIIIMGFTLPAAMGVYWLVGAIFSLAQTLVTQVLIKDRKHK